jgi:hypothetical protein
MPIAVGSLFETELIHMHLEVGALFNGKISCNFV